MTDPRRLARTVRLHVESLAAFGVTALPRSKHSQHISPMIQHKEAQLAQLADDVQRCRACALYQTRTHAVVSDGSAQAQLMFVGEAPGRDEDLQGKPFVGMAGQLLTKMIQAMKFKREDVYICNVLKDRPPANRVPLPEEIEKCFPFLERQIAIVQPKVICALGAVAAKALLGPYVAISKIRGQVMDFHGIPVVPTFHPAYLLRNPSAKALCWADLKRVKQVLSER